MRGEAVEEGEGGCAWAVGGVCGEDVVGGEGRCYKGETEEGGECEEDEELEGSGWKRSDCGFVGG